MIEMSGAGSTSLTVWLSTAVIAPARASLVASSTSPPMRAAIELPSTPASHQRLMLFTTSSAVKSSPLFHLTPWRTLRVYSVALSLADQPSSKRPSKVPSVLYCTRYSSQPRPKLASSDQSQVRGSFIARVSMFMRSVPPATGAPSASALGAARPSSP